MSRYSDHCDESSISGELWWSMIQRSASCARGKKFLQEFIAVLEAMPVKRLASGVICKDGDVCAMGAYGLAKNADAVKEYEGRDDQDGLSLDDTADLGEKLGMARVLAWGVAYKNDESFDRCTPEERHAKVLDWAKRVLAGEIYADGRNVYRAPFTPAF